MGMRPIGTNQQLEQRRRKAVALLDQGHGIRETARLVGASPSTICDWRKAYKNQGDAFFQAHSPPGRQPNLTPKQNRQLEKLLLKGARKNGYTTELWTLQRIAELIEKRFGISYDLSGVWRLLKRMGWSCQKPQKRARERNEQTISVWRKEDCPRIKKSSPKR